MTTETITRRAFPLLLAAALAGCGGPDPASGSPGGAPSSPGPSTTGPGATPPPSAPAAGPVILSLAPASGPEAGGTVVTVTGANFDSVQVLFGVQLGTVVQATRTATSFQVVTPKENPGPVTVVVTNPDGKYWIAPGAFTYTR